MTLEKYITPKLLTELEKISANIKSPMLLNQSGRRKSAQKGSSLEFSDLRMYTQGDDVRKIDWKGYARHEKANIKLFNDERQINVNFFIDFSKSMDYGEGDKNKLFYSCLTALLVGYCHLKSSECVNIYSIGKQTAPVALNVTSAARFNSVVKSTDRAIEENSFNALSAFKPFGIRKGGISFVFSDFYSDNFYRNIISELEGLNHKIILLHILTKQEEEPELDGNFTLTDLEDGKEKNIFLNSSEISKYKKILADFKNEIKSFSLKRNVIYFDFLTDIYTLNTVFKILSRE